MAKFKFKRGDRVIYNPKNVSFISPQAKWYQCNRILAIVTSVHGDRDDHISVQFAKSAPECDGSWDQVYASRFQLARKDTYGNI